MKNKRLLGARTSKKLATLLSLGAIALPLAGCTPAESQQVHEELEIPFCDTSNISSQNYYNGYVKNYADGNTTYIIEQMEEIKRAYEKMVTIPDTVETESSEITFNFDGTVMPYEFKEGLTYYANGEKIKQIILNNVWLKTIDGYLKINMDDNSYIIENYNKKEDIETKITYGEDNSCSIVENNGKILIFYDFDENGLLLHSKEITGEEFVEKEYLNGNPDMCIIEENNQYKKELKKDGSFVITTRGKILNEKLGYNLYGFFKRNNYEEVKYYYDRNEKLSYVVAKEKGNGSFDKVIANPNGKVVYYSEEQNKDGHITFVRKCEQVYDVEKNSLRFETVFEKKVDEFGKIHTLEYKNDYTLINPDNIIYNDNLMYDISYMARDGVVETYSKDGFIYNLNYIYYGEEVSEYFEGHKVEGDTIKYADCNGKIIRSLSKVLDVVYSDYENNVKKSVENLGENEIEVEFNGYNYLLEKDGSISYNSKNSIRYEKNKDYLLYIECDVDGKIKGISRDNYNYHVSYYDYDKNIIMGIRENGIYKGFFEDGCSVRLIENISCEEPYVYDGYELKIGSRLEYNDNKVLSEYYYDDTKYIRNFYNGDHKEVKENGILYIYSWFNDHRLYKIIKNVDDPDNFIETVYEDYENNIISSVTDSQKAIYYYSSSEPGFEQPIYEIKNISDEPLIVYDAEGKEYVLNRDDCITYHRNGHISMLEQGELERRYISKNNSEYYWEVPRGKYFDGSVVKVLHHNEEIIYEGSSSDLFIYNNNDGDTIKITDKNDKIIIPLMESKEQNELIVQEERTIDLDDDER